MGDSGAAPQQRPSERYWFFPPASRRPWPTTRSRLRKSRRHKAQPGTEDRAAENRPHRPRQPRRPGPLRRCSRCTVRCFPRFPLPCRQARPPLPRRPRRPPGRPWHPDRGPQPHPRRPLPRGRDGPGLPQRPGRRPPREPVLWQRQEPPLRRPLLRPLQRRPEQGRGLPHCPRRRPPCRGPAERPPAAVWGPTPPGPGTLQAWGTTGRPPPRFPCPAPPCQRRCPSTRASPSRRGRRRPPEHRKDRDRQYLPPGHCPACPMPWYGWVPDSLAWVPRPGWYSCVCAAPKAAWAPARRAPEGDFDHFYEL